MWLPRLGASRKVKYHSFNTESLISCSALTGKADVTISMKDDDMLNLMLGKLNPQQVHKMNHAFDIKFAYVLC